MVHFILGSAGTGKSTQVLKQITQAAEQQKNIYLFVPEQFTFETERKYYTTLGAKRFQYIKVLSFTRLAHQLFKQFGGIAGDYADNSTKLVLMNLALDEVKTGLQVYRQAMQNIYFSKNILELIREFKNANLSNLDFDEKIRHLKHGITRQKSQDISLIYSTYEAFLSAGYKDSLDDLAKACEIIEQEQYFQDAMVFIDEFAGFTANEFDMIRHMIRQAKQITFTLCTDRQQIGQTSLFSSVNETYTRLKRISQQEQQAIATPLMMTTAHRFLSPELNYLSQHIFRSPIIPYPERNQHIQAVLTANEYDEVDYTLATIRNLIQTKQYRYRDIVIISRDLQTYQNCLQTAFEKYQVPFYMDTLKTITSSPLIRFIQLTFHYLTKPFSSEQLISLLKCGVTPFSFTDIACLENYAYLWNLKKKDWLGEFTFSTYGTNPPQTIEEQTFDIEQLQLLNQIRKTTINALETFQQSVKNANTQQISQAFLQFLEEMGVRETLNQKIQKAGEQSFAEELTQVDEYRRVWEITGEIITTLTAAIGNRTLSIERFGELFSLVAMDYDMGTIPQTLDSVIVGSAERIRTESPKVVFILGANDKVFPYIPEHNGIFTDHERSLFVELGMELAKPIREKIKEEKFIAYKTLSTPSERLYITARKADIKGNTIAISYLYPQLKKMFGNQIIIDTDDLDKFYYCKTPQTAFSVLAYQFRNDTSLTASLKQYFSQHPIYQQQIQTIENQITKGKFHLHNLKQTKNLFGKQVTLSPTKIELYHKCKFRYFCEQGLKLKQRERIQLNAVNRGTIIHDILYTVCSQIKDFSNYDQTQLTPLVQQAVDSYIQKMGGYDHQTERFLYLYQRIQKNVMILLKCLFDELAHSAFKPAAFEYTIGEAETIKPFTFVSKEGITIHIQGTIDRVDTYQNQQGDTFLRVIDYKTGTKEFRLSDIINGLNLQMFLYLLCLQQDNSETFHAAQGAGALYMPASEMSLSLDRYATEYDQEAVTQNHFQMHGVILNDERVIKAMEPDLKGTYTPVSVKKKAFDKDNQLREDTFIEHQANEEFFLSSSLESLLTNTQMNTLFEEIKYSISQMVEELYQGNIEAKPLSGNHVDGCAYCGFKNICGFEQDDPVNDYIELNKKEIFDYLEDKKHPKDS